MSILYLGDIRVRYTRAGEGSAILLLHGTGGTAAQWGALLAPLHQRHLVLAPDLPAHGDSDPLPAKDAWGIWERFPGDFLDALGIDRAAVVAHGLSALAALSWSLREPARVRDLVLIAPAGLRPPRGPLRRLAGNGSRSFRLRWLTSPLGSGRLLRLLVANPSALTPETSEAILEGYRRQRPLAGLWRTSPLLPALPLVPHLVPRTLILFGERDRLLPPRDILAWARMIPRSSGIVLRGTGHLPMMEDPANLMTVLASFFEGYDPPPLEDIP